MKSRNTTFLYNITCTKRKFYIFFSFQELDISSCPPITDQSLRALGHSCTMVSCCVTSWPKPAAHLAEYNCQELATLAESISKCCELGQNLPSVPVPKACTGRFKQIILLKGLFHGIGIAGNGGIVQGWVCFMIRLSFNK